MKFVSFIDFIGDVLWELERSELELKTSQRKEGIKLKKKVLEMVNYSS
jgi:hypothetical protein